MTDSRFRPLARWSVSRLLLPVLFWGRGASPAQAHSLRDVEAAIVRFEENDLR
jgi:hypothetical protein